MAEGWKLSKLGEGSLKGREVKIRVARQWRGWRISEKKKVEKKEE